MKSFLDLKIQKYIYTAKYVFTNKTLELKSKIRGIIYPREIPNSQRLTVNKKG